MATPVEGIGSENNDPTGTVQDPTTDPSGDSGPNPSWSEVLNVLPAEFHPLVTPHFQKWDDSAKSRIESIKGEYESYAPFKEHGIDRDTLSQGLTLYNLLNENPQGLYEALAQQLGVTVPATQQNPTGDNPEGDPAENPQYTLPPDYEKLQAGVNTMAEMLLKQEKDKEQAAAASELEQEMKAIKEKYKEGFNEAHFMPYLAHAFNNGQTDVMKAADGFMAMRDEMIKQTQAQQPFAPTLLGSNSGGGAGIPSNTIDVKKLDPQQRRALVVQMLERNAQRP